MQRYVYGHLLYPNSFRKWRASEMTAYVFLIASALWVLAINVRLRTSWWASLAMGSLLGLGLLTKAFFIPIGASVVAVALLMRYRDGIGRAIMHAAVIAITASMVSAWWYLLQLSSTGVLSGGNEFAAAKKVGLMAGLSSHLQILPLMKALFGIISTATWAGTWSFAVYHAWLLLPLLLLPGLPLVRSIVKDRIWLAEPGAVAMLFLLPFLAGLVYHELAAIASGHVAPNTPGWYLHILIGPISYLWAMGLRGSKFEKILFAFVFSLTAVLWLCQISVFDGVATLDDSGHLPLSTPWWHVHLDPPIDSWISRMGAFCPHNGGGGSHRTVADIWKWASQAALSIINRVDPIGSKP